MTLDCFTGLAAGYDRHRPGYPVEAIDAILTGLGERPRVADVGCGTGISARLLASRGAAVIGIEPNHDMLAEARRAGTPAGFAVEYRAGTAEATGLPDQSVDAVLCAQAFHWFDAEAALREFHRIIRPGGRVALMWNVRDERDAFTQAYEDVVRRSQTDAQRRGQIVERHRSADPTVTGLFVNARTLAFDNPHQFDEHGLLDRARTASYFPRTEPLRSELETELRRAFRAHARSGVVTLAQRTELALADRDQHAAAP